MIIEPKLMSKTELEAAKAWKYSDSYACEVHLSNVVEDLAKAQEGEGK